MRKTYSKLIITDSVLAILFTAVYMFFYLCIKKMIQEGQDTMGVGILVLAPLCVVLLISIVHGIMTYLHYRNIAVPLLILACAFMIVVAILLIFGLITKTEVLYTGIYGVMFSFGVVIVPSFVFALITKLIMFLVGKNKADSE